MDDLYLCQPGLAEEHSFSENVTLVSADDVDRSRRPGTNPGELSRACSSTLTTVPMKAPPLASRSSPSVRRGFWAALAVCPVKNSARRADDAATGALRVLQHLPKVPFDSICRHLSSSHWFH